MQILQSERFKKEYQDIKKFISDCENEKIKNEATKLLNELVSNIKKLDSFHNDISNLKKLGEGAGDTRQTLFEIRKKIYKILDKNT